jgi:hypothetical protein
MDKASQSGQPREASLPLLIGIVAVPVVFVWFLLGKGYGRAVRAVGFGWMAIFISLILAIRPASDHSERTGVPAARPVQTAAIRPTGAAVSGPRAAANPADTGASEEEFRRLYRELQGFRHDQAFLDVGFDRCCRFHAWQLEVQKLNSERGKFLLKQLRVSPADLQTLGFEYLRYGGRSTELAADLESELQRALYRSDASPGRGIVNDLTQGCRNFELVAQYFRLSEEGAEATASSVLNGPGCEKVRPGALTGPVLARQIYHFRSGGTAAQVLVQLQNGHKVWLGEDEVDFR